MTGEELFIILLILVVVAVPLVVYVVKEFSAFGSEDSRIRQGYDRCLVPVFILPIGSIISDLHCIFDFDEVLARVERAAAVEVNYTVWTGRDDCGSFS